MIEGQEGVTWEQWVALASACEEHGVEALFRSDHYISGFDESRHVLDAWTTIAGLAARTTTLKLGTLVSPGTFRHPAVLARGAATADERHHRCDQRHGVRIRRCLTRRRICC